MLFVWYLAWVPHALAHGHSPLFTTYLLAPKGANLMANTSIIAPAVFLWPITAVWGPVVSYNVLACGSLAFSAWAAYLVVRRIVGSEASGVVGGLLYGFSPYMQVQATVHPHLGIALFPPVALWALHELAVVQRRPPPVVGVVFGLAATVQLLTGEELLATTVLMSGVLVIVLALQRRDLVRARARHLVHGLAAASAVLVVFGGPLVAYQMFGPRHAQALLQPNNTYVADLAGFVVPTPLERLTAPALNHLSARFTGYSGEFSVYLGVPLLALAAFAAWRHRRSATVRTAALMAATTMVLSLGGWLHVLGHRAAVPLPWLPFEHLPLARNILPDRFAVFTALALAVLLSAWIAAAWSARSHRRWAVIAVACALVPLVPVLPAATPLDLPPFFSGRAVRRVPAGTTLLVAPAGQSDTLAMAAQLKGHFRFRIPQGGVFSPEGFGSPSGTVFEVLAALHGGASESRAPTCRDAPAIVSPSCRSALVGDLRRLGVDGVVVIDAPRGQADADLFTRLYGRHPEPDGGVLLWMGLPS